MISPRQLRCRVGVALVLTVLGTSCVGESRRPVFPVRGQVFYEGKPTPNALVIFHPLNDPDPRAPRPLGRVGSDGVFMLTTYQLNDGAPAGQFAVTVTWQKDRDQQNVPAEERKDEPNRLPNHYSKPATSGLRVTIREGTNDLPPFQLKKK